MKNKIKKRKEKKNYKRINKNIGMLKSLNERYKRVLKEE